MRHRLLFTAECQRRAHMKQYRLAIEVPPYGAASAKKRMTAPEFFQRVFPDSILPRSSRGAVFYAASRHEKKARKRPAGKTVKFNFLGTGMISVMPVPLLAAHPRECSPQGRTQHVPSVCACRWTCRALPHILYFFKLLSGFQHLPNLIQIQSKPVD